MPLRISTEIHQLSFPWLFTQFGDHHCQRHRRISIVVMHSQEVFELALLSDVLHHCLLLKLGHFEEVPVVRIAGDLMWKQSTGLNLRLAAAAGCFHFLQILLHHTGLPLGLPFITPPVEIFV
ncbi:unnamed protein product [Prunus armeniaca]|uniref:Uncharacterized protein n=1 Tax=Prunus armeniaca TaxID=36596 RepID=A0A6J5VHI1_PRUAR|nr:unnamed protein product [Prunus armeniaca]CAB4317479.1 unnamed protein product [Prunus armeniaca]